MSKSNIAILINKSRVVIVLLVGQKTAPSIKDSPILIGVDKLWHRVVELIYDVMIHECFIKADSMCD